MSSSRLAQRPGELLNRQSELEFSFDGTRRRGLAGDTIASALAASGHRVFSRSFKYHRPRGLLCCAGQCPNCLVDVDGQPGIRACTEPLRDGMQVRHMNAWPSLSFDVMRAVDLLGGPFTPPGFYYKTFIRPRRLWPLYERMLRRAAGLGRLPAEPGERRARADQRTRHADVLVVGGGRSGLHAAIAAAQEGADVVLADAGPVPGGRMLFEGAHSRAGTLSGRLVDLGAEVLSGAAALGWFDGLVAISHGDVLHRVRAEALVVATGSIQQPLAFRRNDLPGVMLAEGAARLAALYAVAPGRRAVLYTIDDEGVQAALALADAGVEVAAVVDTRVGSGDAGERLAARGIELISGSAVVSAHGRAALRGVSVAPLDRDRRPGSVSRRIDCDLLAVSGGRAPDSSLLIQAGARAVYDEITGSFLPQDPPAGVYAAGAVAGHGGADAADASGVAAGTHAAAHSAARNGPSVPEADELELNAPPDANRSERGPIPVIRDGRGGRRCVVCLCEDVTEKDVRAAVAEGFDSIQLAKRYLTATMGPCQGRMCQLPSARSIARETGAKLSAIGTTTARPPIETVPLGLIAGRQHGPGSRSALDAEHRNLGATMDWAGTWRRAYDYGDAGAEALHVHREAGLIDVSPVGKFLIQGRDAASFLDRIYPNRLSTLDPLRIRYGVLVTEAGRIMDDGTVCRLDDETFYVTTTTGGAAAVLRWLRRWLAEWALEARITDLTGTLAAMNLAGPRSREALTSLTRIDLGAGAFPYLHARTGPVAGVECLVLRLGFVGELGYEIHMPAVHSRHVWNAVLDSDSGVEVRPAGLEAQRLLRLEKQHLIAGQDTDSESTPAGAGLSWIVKLDKDDDFLGRWSLEMAAGSPPAERLVGFTSAPGDVAEEGAAVLVDGAPAGRVTSCRLSTVLGQTVGMAWVPTNLASDGAEIEIASNGAVLRATVRTAPFYDPDGELQRR